MKLELSPADLQSLKHAVRLLEKSALKAGDDAGFDRLCSLEYRLTLAIAQSAPQSPGLPDWLDDAKAQLKRSKDT